MDEGLVNKIAEWSNGKLDDEQFLIAVEESRPALEMHRNEFSRVVSELNPQQGEACQELISFVMFLLDDMTAALDRIVEAVKAEDRNTVFVAGDAVARNSFQLNQALVQFRNHALLALGPSDIPNLNLLLQRRDEFMEEPSDQTVALFQEAIDAERILTYHTLSDLGKEPKLPEVLALINSFKAHMASLNKLAEALEADGDEADYEELLEPLEKSFSELRELVPVVQMKLRTTGKTDFPDLNYLLTLIDDLAEGNIGDSPVIEALEAVDESFTKSKELMAQAAGSLESTLANDEVNAILESFEEFEEGMEAIYNFFEQRDQDWLIEGRGCLLDFAKRFSGHQKRLKEIEEQQGQVLCPMCSTPNEVSRTRCSNCGGPLPQNVAAATTSTFETQEKSGLESPGDSGVFITANLAKLYTAVNGVADGSIDHQGFLDEVARFESVLEANVGQLLVEPEAASEQEQAAISKLYDSFEEAIEKLRNALELMKTFPTSGDEEVLAEAVRKVDEGSRLLAAAGEAVKASP